MSGIQQGLLASLKGGSGGILFVGAQTLSFEGGNSTIIQSITNLTGGLSSSPGAGDLVVICGNISPKASALTPSWFVTGYTQIARVNVTAGVYDSYFYSAYKFMGATPDTSISVQSTMNGDNSVAIYVSVWRNVNTTTPMDVLSQTASQSNSILANPPQISPVTTGAYIIAVGGGAYNLDGATYGSSDLTDFRSTSCVLGDFSSVIGGGYKLWTGGTFDPAQFTFSRADSVDNSNASVTMALRPS